MCVNGKGAPTITKVLKEKRILNLVAYKRLKCLTRFENFKELTIIKGKQ